MRSDRREQLPPILRYGRHHGLCLDHRREDVLCKLSETTLDNRGPELPPMLEFVPQYFEPLADVKLQVSQRASKLLELATSQPSAPKWQHLLLDHQRLQNLRVEPPLLMTDHERDMRRFLPRRMLGIENIDLPMEVSDEEHDEALPWPTQLHKLPAQWNKEIAREKLLTTRDIVQFVHQTLEDTWTVDDHKTLVRTLATFKSTGNVELLSPPLVPDDTPFEQYVPSSPALQLPLTCDPASSTSLPKEPSPKAPKYEDYIAFETQLPPKFDLAEYHPSYFKYEDDDLVDYDIDEYTSSTIIEEEKKPTQHCNTGARPETECVSPRSLVAHVTVPHLATYKQCETYQVPSLPTLDDAVRVFEEQKIHRPPNYHKSNSPKRKSSPSKIVAISDKSETIIPESLHGITTSTSADVLNETIEGAHYQLPGPKDVIRSHQMLWKPEQLSFLSISNEDDYDLALDFPKTPLLYEDEWNLKKEQHVNPLSNTKLKLEQDDSEASSVQAGIIPSFKLSVVPEKRKSLEEIIDRVSKQRAIEQKLRRNFSATGSLSSFLSTRSDQSFSYDDAAVAGSNTVQKELLVPGNRDEIVATTDSTMASIPKLDQPRTIFFSNDHLQRYRSLFRFLEKWDGEKLVIVYRDIEVPILLSPRHAMQITTLQALMQRPLPGQASKGTFSVPDQISRFCRHGSFEVLLVLVVIPSSTSSDHSTLLGFSALCDAMSKKSTCHAYPVYVPSGEAELHSHVARLVDEHSFRSGGLLFQIDVTAPERSLVRTGMNHFAAQVILASFGLTSESRELEVRAFWQMSFQERQRRFGHLVGTQTLAKMSDNTETGVL